MTTRKDVSNAVAAFTRAAKAAGIIPEDAWVQWTPADVGSSYGIHFYHAGDRHVPDGIDLAGCTSASAAYQRLTAATRALDAAERVHTARMSDLAAECSPQSIRALVEFYAGRGNEALKTAIQELLVELETFRTLPSWAGTAEELQADRARIIASISGLPPQ